jgi:hypothetical protein
MLLVGSYAHRRHVDSLNYRTRGGVSYVSLSANGVGLDHQSMSGACAVSSSNTHGQNRRMSAHILYH